MFLPDKVEAFFNWEMQSFLGEEDIIFLCPGSIKKLCENIEKMIDRGRPSIIGVPKLPSKRDFVGLIDSTSLLLKKRASIFMWPVFSGIYFYHASLAEDTKTLIDGTYKMFLFPRVFFLLWINFAFIFLALMTTRVALDIFDYFINQFHKAQFLNDLLILLSAILVLLFAMSIIYLIRLFDKRNRVALIRFFESLGCQEENPENPRKPGSGKPAGTK